MWLIKMLAFCFLWAIMAAEEGLRLVADALKESFGTALLGRKNVPFLVLALILSTTQLEAQAPRRTADNSVTPQCNLGTDWSVNKNRPVASDEKLYRLEGGPAIVAQREAPGSTHIVYRRCNVPPGTEAYCSIRGCWIKVCGNDLGSPEGWKFPIEIPMGAPGVNGRDGKDGRDGRDGQIVYAPPASTALVPDFDGRYKVRGDRGFWCFRGAGQGAFCTAIATTAVLVAKNNLPRKDDEPKGGKPIVVTLPNTILMALLGR